MGPGAGGGGQGQCYWGQSCSWEGGKLLEVEGGDGRTGSEIYAAELCTQRQLGWEDVCFTTTYTQRSPALLSVVCPSTRGLPVLLPAQTRGPSARTFTAAPVGQALARRRADALSSCG